MIYLDFRPGFIFFCTILNENQNSKNYPLLENVFIEKNLHVNLRKLYEFACMFLTFEKLCFFLFRQ